MATLLEIDPQAFTKGFSERSFVVRHALLDHPLLTLESIARLADELPSESVWRRSGDRAVGVASAGEDPDTGPPSETIRDIDRNGRWVMLRFIEQVPEYAALVNSCLDDVEPYLASREGGMAERNGYLFLSSPSAVTPVHFDSEHNLLLQIRGTKEVSVCEFADEHMQAHAVERHWDHVQPDFNAMTAEAQTYKLLPGDGIYMAPYLPHWVQNGEEVSISLSIPFYTKVALRTEHVNKVNARLRRLRLRPRAPGASETVDRAKDVVFNSGLKVREAVKRFAR
jgi:hypothetical protein